MSYVDDYFHAEKVRIIDRISDPDYFHAEKVRIIDRISDPDYFHADKVRIIDNVSDPDYFRVKKVRVIDRIGDPDYFHARKVRVVKLSTYSTQPSITKSKNRSTGIGGFCLVVIAVLVIGGIIWGLAGLAATTHPGQSSSGGSYYTYDRTYLVSQAKLSGNVIHTPEGAKDIAGNLFTPGISLSYGGSATFQVNVSNAGAYFLRISTTDSTPGNSVQVSVNNGAPMSVNIVRCCVSDSSSDVTIQLVAGDNTIVLSNQSPEGGESADFCVTNFSNCIFIANIEVLMGSQSQVQAPLLSWANKGSYFTL
jgi:hypothetical protein